MAEVSNSDPDMMECDEESPHTNLTVSPSQNELVLTEATSTSVQESVEETEHTMAVKHTQVQVQNVRLMQLQNKGPFAKDCNFSNNQGHITFAMAAGGSNQPHDVSVKEAIQQLDEKVDARFDKTDEKIETVGKKTQSVGSEVDAVGKKVNEVAQQNEWLAQQSERQTQQLADLAKQVKDVKTSQLIGIDQLSELLQKQLQLAKETKHQVDSLGPKEDPTEEIGALRAVIEKAMMTIYGKLKDLSTSEQQMIGKVETMTAEVERNRLGLQMNQVQQEQMVMTIVNIQENLQSVVKKVEHAQARMEHSEGQIKEAARQLGSQRGGAGNVVPLIDEFRRNLLLLKSNMKRRDEVITHLFASYAITDEDMEELADTKSRDKVERLLQILSLKNNGCTKLKDALKATDQGVLVDAMK